MRTTITLDDDIVAAVEQIRRESGAGMSVAVNDLARAGLMQRRKPGPRKPFVQRTVNLGLTIDVSNIGEALDLLDQYGKEDHAE